MAVICKPKKRKELDDIILQGKIEVCRLGFNPTETIEMAEKRVA